MRLRSLAVIMGILGLFIFGCGPKIEKFGDAPDESVAKTAISSILLDPKKFIEKEVVIEGIISSECPSGCWMNVRDNSEGTIYVEMLGNSFVPLPQRSGKAVLVKGTIFQSKSGSKQAKLFCKGLTIK